MLPAHGIVLLADAVLFALDTALAFSLGYEQNSWALECKCKCKHWYVCGLVLQKKRRTPQHLSSQNQSSTFGACPPSLLAQLLPQLRSCFGSHVEVTLSQKAEALAHVSLSKVFLYFTQWLAL